MDLKNPTRTEALLANIAGHTDVPVPDLKNATRSERLLKEILDNGGGGGDVTKEYVDTAIADAVADIDDDISALSGTVADKVDKEDGKGLSTNDYTDADKALVQDSPITVTATASPISTANGKPRKLTVYGKSEVVDGAIKSAGEGYAVVKLADLTWEYRTTSSTFTYFYTSTASFPSGNIKYKGDYSTTLYNLICSAYSVVKRNAEFINKTLTVDGTTTQVLQMQIKDTAYTTVSDFVASLGDATLTYELADPTQGNAIAIKTDNGSGINGTMATFTTGTPLRGIPDTTVRDVMEWNGSSGEVTKNCGEVDLGTATYTYDSNNKWFSTTSFASTIKPTSDTQQANILSSIYAPNTVAQMLADQSVNMTCATNRFGTLIIRNTDYTDPAAFKTAMNGVKLIYELATPTTQSLTSIENASIAGLRTFEPSTHAQNNAGATMTIEAYAGTANGKAVAELKSELKITQSDTLTLTVVGWSSNQQTVTFAHDVSKRNSIDVEPANIKAWTAAGILATAETASTITFECDTVPTADLSFRITSMEVR